jgi:peptidoglycan/xylan/chitin deacetylase (PgdA/CDA1 family)
MIFTGMPAEAERPIIAGVLEAIAKSTGKKSRGWLGPVVTETDNTPDILADLGIEYLADWCNDELPYPIKTKTGSLFAIPYTLEIGDIPMFLERGGSGEDFYRMIVDQFDQLYEEGGTRPRVLSIAIHPFLIGHPFRARHLDRALAHIRKHQSVWLTTGGGIIDWYKAASDGKA